VDAAGKLHSIYRCGKNRLDEARERGVQMIQEGEKHRFIWVLAQPGSLEYAAWRKSLPGWVVNPEWGKNAGFVQPRLLSRLRDALRTYTSDLWSTLADNTSASWAIHRAFVPCHETGPAVTIQR
jgi:hypothetical protein